MQTVRGSQVLWARRNHSDSTERYRALPNFIQGVRGSNPLSPTEVTSLASPPHQSVALLLTRGCSERCELRPGRPRSRQSRPVSAVNGIDQQVVDLASQIKAAQEPEITQLKEWLTTWGSDAGGMSGMDHGTDGMMSADDMTALAGASGVEASKLFLNLMTVHHEGAIAMAQLNLDEGLSLDPPVGLRK